MITISAILTSVNRPTYSEAFHSILNQSRRPDELIVVWDTKSPPCIQSPEARFIWTEYKKNPCIARNLGAQSATSQYLAFLDDDDYWCKDHLRRLEDCILVSDAEVICTSIWKLRNRALFRASFAPDRLQADAFFTNNPGIRASNLCIRRETYQKLGGFDPTMPSSNDLDFAIRLADAGATYIGLKVRTVVFRVHSLPRLSTPGSAVKAQGLRTFWLRYRERMTPKQKRVYLLKAVQKWKCHDFLNEVPSSGL